VARGLADVPALAGQAVAGRPQVEVQMSAIDVGPPPA